MEENFTADPKDVQDNKAMGILAYLGPLVLVPIFAAKESPFARFHANQGLILLIVAIGLSIILSILTSILLVISLSLFALTSILTSLFGLCVLVFMILGIINAAKGEMKELPFIGKYRIIK